MTTPALFHLSSTVILDQNGKPMPNARVYFYDAGTNTPRTTYTTKAMVVANQWPVLTDGYGRIPVAWLGEGDYSARATTPFGAQIFIEDDLPGGTPDPDPTPVVTVTIPTGFVMEALSIDIVDGWLPLNGRTIGNGASGASLRASDDVQALYTLCWNNDATLDVVGGRGASALSDFVAGKAMAIPDWRGRSPIGADGMGNTLAKIITSVTTPTPDTIGTKFGREGANLTVEQLPSFAPVVTIGQGGVHLHSGNADNVTGHQHTGITDDGGSHVHVIETVASGSGTGARGIFGGGLTDQFTDAGGIHGHSFTTAVAGAHGHTLTIANSVTHNHTATSATVGSGQDHLNMQPSVICWFHVKI